MAMQYPQQSYTFVSAENTSVPANFPNTAFSCNSVYPTSFNVYINESLLIPYSNKGRHVRVLRSFSIEVQMIKGGFVAVSDVSDVFELGETPTQAVLSYLYSVVDELIWFQEHQKSLSLPMLKDLGKLQLYLRLV